MSVIPFSQRLAATQPRSDIACAPSSVANGAGGDLVDTHIFDELERDVVAGKFNAAFACPPCTPFSVLDNRPGRAVLILDATYATCNAASNSVDDPQHNCSGLMVFCQVLVLVALACQ